MKTAVFKPSDPTQVLFMDNFKTFRDNNCVNEDFAMWLFPHFISKPFIAVLSQLVKAYKQNHQQEDNLKT